VSACGAQLHEPYLMQPEGAWSEDGTAWYAREHFPTRSKARTEFANFTGIPWIEVRVLARFSRHAPDDPAAGEYDGEYWVECDADAPGAFPVWRCE
jgi:hypothetical protein